MFLVTLVQTRLCVVHKNALACCSTKHVGVLFSQTRWCVILTNTLACCSQNTLACCSCFRICFQPSDLNIQTTFLCSVFYPTNETLNIWTHFIPFLLMLYRTHCIFTSLESPTDLIYWPFWLHSFGEFLSLFSPFLLHSSRFG